MQYCRNAKGKYGVDGEFADPPKTLTHKYKNEIGMVYGIATKVNDSRDVVGVQVYPYNCTCKMMLTEEVVENHRLTAVRTHKATLKPDSPGWVESNRPQWGMLFIRANLGGEWC